MGWHLILSVRGEALPDFTLPEVLARVVVLHPPVVAVDRSIIGVWLRQEKKCGRLKFYLHNLTDCVVRHNFHR
jgi:hypothetical protein